MDTEIDWAYITSQLPYKKTKSHRLQRKELWKRIDINGNKYISLAELDKGISHVLNLPHVFHSKPAII